jgi:fucose permease
MLVILVIIYIAFISLGLPDAILGTAWPVLHLDLNVNIAYAGILSMIVSAGTVVSSLMSETVIKKFGVSRTTAFSVLLTALSLAGFTFSQTFATMCFLAIPLGLGAGAVDSALNNFVAIHYKAIHMNWLHAFWGIGATAGPMMMSIFIMQQGGWRIGYGIIAILQVILAICLFATLPLWKKVEQQDRLDIKNEEQSDEQQIKKTRIVQLLFLPGAKAALLSFFCYCSVEFIAGIWGATYLVKTKVITPETAARWVGMYYLGITIGRILSGLLAIKTSNRQLIRIGLSISIIGVIFMLLPNFKPFQLTGLILLGLGCAPIFPAMLHETPINFGKDMSQGVIGIQMATAYIGSTIMPPLFGILASTTSFNVMPIVLMVILCIELFSTETIKVQIKRN